MNNGWTNQCHCPIAFTRLVTVAENLSKNSSEQQKPVDIWAWFVWIAMDLKGMWMSNHKLDTQHKAVAIFKHINNSETRSANKVNLPWTTHWLFPAFICTLAPNVKSFSTASTLPFAAATIKGVTLVWECW